MVIRQKRELTDQARAEVKRRIDASFALAHQILDDPSLLNGIDARDVIAFPDDPGVTRQSSGIHRSRVRAAKEHLHKKRTNAAYRSRVREAIKS